MKIQTIPFLSFAVLFGFNAGALSANEGMWAFHDAPTGAIRQAYGFSPSQAWLDHVRLSSLRVNDGGSASFVSPDGLVLTNHHVALGAVQKLSDGEHDYVRDGFIAQGRDAEMPLKDTEINVLVGMENVTARVAEAGGRGATEGESNRLRKAEIAAIEKESTDATGLRSDVVTLYQGGEYWLYRYKKFTDVRLVMTPEMKTGFYGGDPDNFTYPRHNLDMTFLRVYENGEPYRPEHWLAWSPKGAADGELVFVSGHPGKTQRLKTLSELQTVRDVSLPAVFESYQRIQQVLKDYSAEGPEQKRQAQSTLFSVNNALKVYDGRIAALNAPAVWDKKAQEEKELRSAAAQDPLLGSSYGEAWDRIDASQKLDRSSFIERMYAQFGGGRLAAIAKTIVESAEELAKPNGNRWEEYRDSGLESLKLDLFSSAPIYPEMEKRLLSSRLEAAAKKLGADHPFVRDALDGLTPQQVAQDAVSRTRLADVDYRKELFDGGIAAVRGSDDPLIRLALKLAPHYRDRRSWYETFVEAVERAAGALIAQARFAIYGKTVYPDATFTLRLSYGRVAGYEEGTTSVPHKTTFYGLYNRAASFDGREPFDLAPRVAEAANRVDLSTPLNFVTTNDIIGGNSGSPVINREGELVGLVFDGNIQSLSSDYIYTDQVSRTVAVHSAGILEALSRVYGAAGLVEEVTQGTMRAFTGGERGT